MPVNHEITVFEKCVGLNDSTTVVEAVVNHQTGDTEVTNIAGLTLSAKGKLKGADNLLVASTEAAANITSISAFSRVVVQIGTGLYTYNGSTFTAVTDGMLPVVLAGTAKIVHTHLDVRYCDNGKVYKIPNGSNVASLTAAGTWAGPITSKVYYGMPNFTGGFVFNGRLYSFKDTFLSYSEPWHYDCWDLADGFIGVGSTIIGGACTLGSICLLCSNKVVVLVGTDPSNFVYTEYELTPCANTLAAKYIEGVGNVAVFVAASGLYVVEANGNLTNITFPQITSSLNRVYSGALLTKTKYIAASSTGTVYYDFALKAVYTDNNFLVSGITRLNDIIYCTAGKFVNKLVEQTIVAGSVTFPFSDYLSVKRKRVRALYVTGKFIGDLTVTITGNSGVTKSKTATLADATTTYRITGFGSVIDHFLSVKLELVGTYFHLERVKVIAYQVN